jgi:hypothetical protein
MAQQLKSRPPVSESRPLTSDEIVIWPTRAKYRPRWPLAYIALSAILWSAIILLAVRAVHWLSQQ